MRFSLIGSAIAFVLVAVAKAEHLIFDHTGTGYNFGIKNIDITAKVGDQIELKLKENPSTGYSWLLLQGNADNAEPLAKFISEKYVPDSS